MLNSIKQSVKEAMVASCNDTLEFTDEPSRKFNAEYLFTVNTAKSINQLNGYNADPYSIYIEKSTKSFARDCLRPYVSGHPLVRGTGRIRKGTPKIDRNGRIDLAVYAEVFGSGYIGKQPICAIEVKGFNPPRKLVIADLKRNLEFLRVSGNTGESVLEFSIFAALHSFEKSTTDVKAAQDVESVEVLYLRWISEVGSISDVQLDLKAFTVSKELIGRVLDEGEYMALDTDSQHHFVGIILCFVQKKSNNSLQGRRP